MIQVSSSPIVIRRDIRRDCSHRRVDGVRHHVRALPAVLGGLTEVPLDRGLVVVDEQVGQDRDRRRRRVTDDRRADTAVMTQVWCS